MKTVLETIREITENKWFMLITAIVMMYGSISLLWGIAATTTTSRITYKINGIKRELNDNTFIETKDKLYRIRAFKLNGDAIIQEIWEDTKTKEIKKGEKLYKSKKEMINIIENCIKIHKGP